MPKTIAELRASKSVGQASGIYPLSLNGELTAKFQVLSAELEELREDFDDTPGPDPDNPSKSRSYSDADPRVAKLDAIKAKEAEAEAIRAEMEADMVEVLLRAKPSGEWIEWDAEHPARDEDADDERMGFNFDALIRDLPDHIATVSGEPLAEGDGEWLLDMANHGDLRAMAQMVARLQYGGIRVPKSLSAWSSDLESSSA